MKTRANPKRTFLYFWFGITLTTLFFYPLLSALHDNIWFLQWSLRNTAEFLPIYLIISTILTGIIFAIARLRYPRLKLLAASLLALVPMLSFKVIAIAQFADKLPLGAMVGWLQARHMYPPQFGSIAVMSIILLAGIYRAPRTFLRIGTTVLLVLSSLNLFAFWTIVTIDHFEDNVVQQPISETGEKFPNIYIFLFDGLSYEYLYDKEGKIKPAYPNIAAFSAVSDNYHQARMPDKQTLHSIPKFSFNMVDGQEIKIKENSIVAEDEHGDVILLREREDSIFAQAQESNYTVAIFGPYLRYCSVFKTSVNQCISYSTYNYGDVNPSLFSLLNPIMTNVMIWPNPPPYGWFKVPARGLWYKQGIERMYQWTTAAFRLPSSVFLFSHFYVPHRPYYFNRSGYNPPSDPYQESSENYERQLEYVDTLVGKLVVELKQANKFEDSFIVIMSDHNYRAMFPEAKDHTPLLIKRPSQTSMVDIRDSVLVNDIIWKLTEYGN